MESRAVSELAELGGYTVESPLLPPHMTLRHPTLLGGLTVVLKLNTRLATVVIDGLGKRSLISGRWRHYKLKRRNLDMNGLQILLRNPFRGTFRQPLQDGWVEHGSRVHRHNDDQLGGGFAFHGIFHIIIAGGLHGFHDLDVHIVSSDEEDLDEDGNISDVEGNDDVENNTSDVESNDDVENNASDVENNNFLPLQMEEM